MEMIADCKIRKITPDDYLGLHNVYFLTWLNTYPNKEFNITVDDIEYKYEQRLTPEKIEEYKNKILEKGENKINLLAEYQGKIIGLCNAINDICHNEIQAIYVLPKYQGRGLGSSLWKEASKIFDLQKNTFVNVVSYNKQAINFYKKLGFEITGEVFFDERFKMRNGSMFPELRMIKKE
jgi:ribosomal protein S18 acetylase RimI-like enzyme